MLRGFRGALVRFRNSLISVGPPIGLHICQTRVPCRHRPSLKVFEWICSFCIMRLPFARWTGTRRIPSWYLRTRETPWKYEVPSWVRGFQFLVDHGESGWANGGEWKIGIMANPYARRQINLRFHGKGSRPWLPERRSGPAQGIHNR